MPRELHIHVEEPSMAEFLRALLPRFLDPQILWRPIDYSSKQQLLARLPQRLIGYAKIPSDSRPLSLVLVDRDDDDCIALKARLNQACQTANLLAGSVQQPVAPCDVINRVVIEELEAWYFGDGAGMDAAWNGSGRYARRAAYRDSDAIRGGTHEALLRVLKSAGHFRGLDRLPKIEAARTMGAFISPDRCESRSFQHFWAALHRLIAVA